MIRFDITKKQFIGLGGSLSVLDDDDVAWKYAMLLIGECSSSSRQDVAHQFGFSKQRYYQLRKALETEGLTGLVNNKRGPQTTYRRHSEVVCQTIRHRFLDPEATTAVIAQKLRQSGFPISKRTVDRIIEEFGLQKKTLRVSSRSVRSRCHLVPDKTNDSP